MVSKAQAAQIDASDTADPEEIEWYMQSEIAHAAASDPEGSSDPRAHATESVASEPIWDHSEDEGESNNAEQEANDADPIWDHSEEEEEFFAILNADQEANYAARLLLYQRHPLPIQRAGDEADSEGEPEAEPEGIALPQLEMEPSPSSPRMGSTSGPDSSTVTDSDSDSPISTSPQASPIHSCLSFF